MNAFNIIYNDTHLLNDLREKRCLDIVNTLIDERNRYIIPDTVNIICYIHPDGYIKLHSDIIDLLRVIDIYSCQVLHKINDAEYTNILNLPSDKNALVLSLINTPSRNWDHKLFMNITFEPLRYLKIKVPLSDLYEKIYDKLPEISGFYWEYGSHLNKWKLEKNRWMLPHQYFYITLCYYIHQQFYRIDHPQHNLFNSVLGEVEMYMSRLKGYVYDDFI